MITRQDERRLRAAWLCDKAELAEDNLTDWERKFIDDIDRRMARDDGFAPSDKQMAVLERIGEKA